MSMVNSITEWGCHTAAGMWTVWRMGREGVVAEAVPGVSVFYERAKVGYEVAIGSVDKR